MNATKYIIYIIKKPGNINYKKQKKNRNKKRNKKTEKRK
jgi:hypothetical protein